MISQFFCTLAIIELAYAAHFIDIVAKFISRFAI